jgi:hypothetical protein
MASERQEDSIGFMSRKACKSTTNAPKWKVSAKLREHRRPPAAPNDIWAMDFLSDQLFDGRKIRVLTIMDCPFEGVACH